MSAPGMVISEHLKRLITLALEEDVGSGDITSCALIAEGSHAEAVLLAKEPLVVCGQDVAREVFMRLDPGLHYEVLIGDGAQAAAGTVLSRMRGCLRAILAGERTALNFVQRLSAISTKTALVVQQIKNSGVSLLDTRKTTPGLRELEKYAVRTGGGVNHRQGLFDAVLIKNNHVDAVGGDVAYAVKLCRDAAPAGVLVEVEVRDQAELDAALRSDPDVIMLDNFTPQRLRAAVHYVRNERQSAVALEASGGITEANVTDYAVSGLTYLSLGSLTHSVRASDIALRLVK